MQQEGLLWAQLRDLRDQLKTPLTNRSVLIPFGSRAFIPGTLHATKRIEDDLSSSASESSEWVEVVLDDRDGSSRRETMTRQDALEFLQNEMLTRQKSKTVESSRSNATLTTSNSMDTRSNSTKADLKQNVTKSPSPNESRSNLSTTLNSFTAPTPKESNLVASNGGSLESFFEIREELDEYGILKSGEAVNITKHLEYLRKQEQANQEKIDQTGAPDSQLLNDDDVSSFHFSLIPPEKPLKCLSNEAYADLAERLDSLAKLEDESEKQKPVSAKSAIALQGTGWKKGFFNSNTKKKHKNVSTNRTLHQSSVSSNQSLNFSSDSMSVSRPQISEKHEVRHKPVQSLIATNKDEAVASEKQATTVVEQNTQQDQQQSRKVVFVDERNETKQIPRIGQRSIKEESASRRMPSVPLHHPNASANDNVIDVSRVSTWDETMKTHDNLVTLSAVAPVIVEKKKPKKKNIKSRQILLPQERSNSPHMEVASSYGQEETTKKMSQFKLERTMGRSPS